MHLAIYKLEDDSKPLCILSEGAHSLGRGTQLACSDKRISRNHVSIVIDTTNATFSLVHHTNPCYWKCADSRHIALLKPNTPMEINHGDTFGFFPDVHWFKIKHCEPGMNNNVDTAEATPTSTTVIDTATTSHVEPIIEQEIPNNCTLETSRIEETEANVSGATNLVEDREKEGDSTSNITNNTDNAQKTNDTVNNEVVNSNLDPNAATSSNSADNQPSCSNTSQKKVFRDRCWYGANCYRKNTKHRVEFSHPDDPDYDTDPEDDHPACPHGRNCFRRNADHRKNHKHSRLAKAVPTATKRPADDNNDDNADEDDAGAVNPGNILPNKRKRKPRQPKTKKAKVDGADGDEDDEYESDFIDDEPFDTDDDDDFVLTDSGSDYE